MMHVPNDRVLAQQNDKVAIFAPYHLESVALAINEERLPDWQGFDAFARERIAVDGGSFSAQIMLGMDGGQYREHVAMCRNIHEALAEFTSGKAAAIMGMRSELEAGAVTKAPYRLVDFSIAGAPRRSWAVGLAVKSERTELAGRLTAALHELQAKGAIAAIFARHGVRYIQP
jgi:ABC-type amino acid transport substrate-binding protein